MSAADAEIDPLDAYMASLELPDGGSQQMNGPGTGAAGTSDADARQWRRARVTASNDVVVKNRRYRRLQQLLRAGDAAPGASGSAQEKEEREDAYFSDAMMQQRSPALFHFYVGQYLIDREEPPPSDTAPMPAEAVSLSSFLMKTRERSEMETRRLAEQEGWGRYESRDDAAARKREARLFEEEEQEEEEEEDDSSSEEEETKESEGGDYSKASINIEERRRQLVEIMSARFLHGDDGEYINYAEVDADEALDDLDEMDRDAQDRYFATDD